MIDSFSLKNFKAFGSNQKIPLKPITLIYGANSSGKSSVIHGYLFLRNLFKTGNCDIDQISIGGEVLDLGGFKQYLHKKEYGSRILETAYGISVPAGLDISEHYETTYSLLDEDTKNEWIEDFSIELDNIENKNYKFEYLDHIMVENPKLDELKRQEKLNNVKSFKKTNLPKKRV